MAKKKNRKNSKKFLLKEKNRGYLALPEEIKRKIWGVLMFLFGIIVSLSFFKQAGLAGVIIFSALDFLIGRAVFILPLILFLGGLVFFVTTYKKFLGGIITAILILILGISGFLECLNSGILPGGWLGYIFTFPFLKFFGILVTQIIFAGLIAIGVLIFWYLLKQPYLKEAILEHEKKPSLIRKIFSHPRFKIKTVEPQTTFEKEAKIAKESLPELKTRAISPAPSKVVGVEYQMPPFDLLDSDKGRPVSGDIRQNSAVIKKTLESFEIPVEMAEVNIGPTVTQYTLKPADGIKLSKITSLSNDLSLALASHPIRIEAPIPGRSLVGIEVPNKLRTMVRLRDLVSSPQFQKSSSSLTFCLGRDVSGNAIYADLARFPHLLVAGATGTGKTIFLNSLILSLLYRNSPEILRFILIDPKRVEFPVYGGLPHLLSPVIYDAQKTINALKWAVEEMERRFGILAEVKARDIDGYNQLIAGNSKLEIGNSKFERMPYIVLIVDELADLMAARGKEVEAGIVRLAQMARAVGIHLVVATQRPSVEVITGLIKANITSRVTFQVASQVDSRTVLDMAGAEKLLGSGDLLFISAEIVKPKRIQGAYVSEKEVKRVVNWIKSKTEKAKIEEGIVENHLAENLEKALEMPESEFPFQQDLMMEEDPLYEEAKRVVIEARKASASLLQRRLRIGYARAARLIDILEERGLVGPANGAKPREVYFKTEGQNEETDDWQKI